MKWRRAGRPPLTIPPDLELTADPSEWQPKEFLAVNPKIPAGMESLPGSWKLIAPDTITMFWTSGYVGVDVRLQVVNDDALTGRATGFHDDVRGPTPMVDLVLRRRPC